MHSDMIDVLVLQEKYNEIEAELILQCLQLPVPLHTSTVGRFIKLITSHKYGTFLVLDTFRFVLCVDSLIWMKSSI